MLKFPVEDAGLCSCLQALVLVVPGNAYNPRVPLVIGTNIVRECKDHCEEQAGAGFLQRIHTSSAWKRAYQLMRVREHLVGGHRKVLTKVLKVINYSYSSYPTRASYTVQVDGFRNPTRMETFLICILIKQEKPST